MQDLGKCLDTYLVLWILSLVHPSVFLTYQGGSIVLRAKSSQCSVFISKVLPDAPICSHVVYGFFCGDRDSSAQQCFIYFYQAIYRASLLTCTLDLWYFSTSAKEMRTVDRRNVDLCLAS